MITSTRKRSSVSVSGSVSEDDDCGLTSKRLRRPQTEDEANNNAKSVESEIRTLKSLIPGLSEEKNIGEVS